MLLAATLASGLCTWAWPGSNPGVEEDLPRDMALFLEEHCARCHGPKKEKAGFRVDRLQRADTAEEAERWNLVLEMLEFGDMPPKDEPQPTREASDAAQAWIRSELSRAKETLAGSAVETPLRPLNALEYRFVLEDLFGAEIWDAHADIGVAFPIDDEALFDNDSAALRLSAEQIEQYFHTADRVLQRVMHLPPEPERRREDFTLGDLNELREREFIERQEMENRRRPVTTEEEQEARRKQRELHAKARPYFPKYEDDYLIPSRNLRPRTEDYFRVSTAGWYRFEISAYAARQHEKPLRLEITYGDFKSADATPEFLDLLVLSGEAPVQKSYSIFLRRGEGVALHSLDAFKQALGWHIPKMKGPAVAIRSLSMEGPLLEEWPPRGFSTLFGGRNPSDLSDRDCTEILSTMAPRLFRRPASGETLAGFEDFYRRERAELSPFHALHNTLRAMLCSPRFIYHHEPVGEDGKLDDHALAARLSFFLWRSLPDDELLELAATGRLNDPEHLHAQVERMLDDEKAQRFLEDFVGQWLDIQKVGEMQPDEKLYPEYDLALEHSIVRETELFLWEMIAQDLPVSDLIASDWAMLNARLAEHYDIEDVEGMHFRRVALQEQDTVRGGLLTQASILNITSNGTTTSPVVRGTWILENLLGTPPSPPPPGVTALEPDIRGATTILEQLEKHRAAPQCSTCHQRIDPYGLALENFDVIGGWRDRYRATRSEEEAENSGGGVEGKEVPSKGRLPSGDDFDGFLEFRELLEGSRPLVELNTTEVLASFALGRAMEFSDREALEAIVQQTNDNAGGLRTLLHQLVQSPLFQRP